MSDLRRSQPVWESVTLYEEETRRLVNGNKTHPVALTSASLMAMSREWVGQMKEAAANGEGTGSPS
jgi:hypothetical protein